MIVISHAHPTIKRVVPLFAALIVGTATSLAIADDWGAYALIPASAPALVLEAVGSGRTEGTVVSIGKPTNSPNQKWVITAKPNKLFHSR